MILFTSKLKWTFKATFLLGFLFSLGFVRVLINMEFAQPGDARRSISDIDKNWTKKKSALEIQQFFSSG